MKKQLLALAVIAAATGTAQAEQFWADNSVSVLYGEDYTMTPNNGEKNAVTNMTLEHVSGHSWGSLFFFVDRLVGEGDYNETYGEFSPTFTLKKFEEGSFVKSINAAFTYEFGSSTTSKFFLPEGGAYSQDNYLYGIGADLAIPGMNYFSTTYYYSQRNNTFTNGDNDHQLTFVYGWSSGNLNIDGFLDWSTGTDQHDSELNFTPQITYNVGPAMGVSNKVKVGLEYSYWNNKFGAKGMEDKDRDQSAISLLLKVHL